MRKPTNLIPLTLCVISVLYLGSCQKDVDPERELQVEFSFNVADPENESGRQAAVEAEDIRAIVISIEDESGNSMYSNEEMPLYNFEGEYTTKPLSFKTGTYYITKFIVINNDMEVVYVCPVEGSEKAHLVDLPLPYRFNVSIYQNAKWSPQVVSTEGSVASEFGYGSFGFNEMMVIDFAISPMFYNYESDRYQTTNADLSITTRFRDILETDLKEGTNLVSVSDRYQEYTITVSKPGYKPVQENYQLHELRAFRDDPLIVLLEDKFEFEVVTKIPEHNGIIPERIEAMEAVPYRPFSFTIATRNEGAECGGGTPAALWLDEVSGGAIEASFIQSLPLTNSVPEIFANFQRIMFTGSGWCGDNSAYYSKDQGVTWNNSVSGPPSSIYSFADFNNVTFAGTGLGTTVGEVYRWTGGGTWRRLHQLPAPRTLVSSMVEFNGQLFIGSANGEGSQTGGSPVITTGNGTTFSSTSGIPSDMDVDKLLVVNGELMAITRVHNSNFRAYFYMWDNGVWKETYNPGFRRVNGNHITVMDNMIVMFARTYGGQYRIWISDDYAKTWHKIPWDYPEVSLLKSISGRLFFGTAQNDIGEVMIYRLNL
ncbi:glycoside hydrolase [Fulvivirga ulvae]|uniref:sialidase family protein n=1 Tax=Fulvivirga ulvae TaxID=2904245 RepID=UPI001F2E318F|nr:sialidase family protein [Fulvivirga ulvae]UII30473.1 glycoside hydrolase [Fulvivirga ulvae]